MNFAARFLFIMFICITFLLPAAHASTDWNPLIQRLISDKFDEKTILSLFSRPDVKFDPDIMSYKLKELISSRSGKIKKPKISTAYGRFLEPPAISAARLYMEANLPILKDVEKAYCVPREIIVAILLVETDLGGYLGKRSAFNSLASMALSDNLDVIRPYLPEELITTENEDYAKSSCRKRADWAYGELKALIHYSNQRGIDPVGFPGSIYGAIGLCQFMPSNIPLYGIDADKDGHIDLFSKHDAFHSMANYLRAHGWKCKTDKRTRFKIIRSYNYSDVYANTVIRVAEKLSKAP